MFFNFKTETRHCIVNAWLRYLTINYFETGIWNTERDAVLFILLSFQITIYWYRPDRIGNIKPLLALSMIIAIATRTTTRASRIYYQPTHWYLNDNSVHFQASVGNNNTNLSDSFNKTSIRLAFAPLGSITTTAGINNSICWNQ